MKTSARHGHTAESTYQWIKGRILQNHWPDGAPLKEGDLARQIGVSRTPVREALRRLTLEGMVETVPNMGSRLQKWSDEDLNDIFGLRLQLESYGAQLAAARIAPDEVEELYSLCADMEECQRLCMADSPDVSLWQRLAVLNERFHVGVQRAAHSERLETLLRQVISASLVRRTFRLYEPAEIARSMAHHRELVDALAARDPVWAESVMRAHLSAGYRAAQRCVASNTDGDPAQAGQY